MKSNTVFAKLSSPSPINYVTLPRRLYRYHVGQQSVHVVLEILEAHVLDQLPHELQRATPHRQQLRLARLQHLAANPHRLRLGATTNEQPTA